MVYVVICPRAQLSLRWAEGGIDEEHGELFPFLVKPRCFSESSAMSEAVYLVVPPPGWFSFLSALYSDDFLGT